MVRQLKEKKLKFSVEDPDAPENWPRVWFIWRGNALMSSAKGHEYFLRHYLGTHSNAVAPETAKGEVDDVAWREPAPKGKLDLVVDLNFRMDTTALYSDVILPAATWYEKDDLNSTDMHSFIHPLQAAVPPCWESRSDWDIFKAIAEKVSELAKVHLPEPVREIVTRPLQHDTPAEMAQRELRDWAKGECEPEPGKTMPGLAYVDRDYVNLHNRFVSFGPVVRAQGIGAHGITWPVDDLYDELVRDRPTGGVGGQALPVPRERQGRRQRHPAPGARRPTASRPSAPSPPRRRRSAFPSPTWWPGAGTSGPPSPTWPGQPRRLIDSPCWTGITGNGRTYSAYCLNVERLVPWRTLTGRQHFYLDHPGLHRLRRGASHLQAEAHPGRREGPRGVRERPAEPAAQLPHAARQVGHPLHLRRQPAHAHPVARHPSALGERPGRGHHRPRRTTTGSRPGTTTAWWWCAAWSRRASPRACACSTTRRSAPSACPKSPERGGKRAGGHNSLTRVRLKPTLMLGGYGQFTFALNYWGPTGNNRDTFIRVRKLAVCAAVLTGDTP